MPRRARRLLLPRMVLCAAIGVVALRAIAADRDGGTPIGPDDFAPAVRSGQSPAPAPAAEDSAAIVVAPAPSPDYATPPGVVRTQPVTRAAAAPASPPAFRPPLPGQLAADGDLVYTVSDPPASGVYHHPAGLYVLRFPGGWRMMRGTGGDAVAYTFSAEAGRVAPKQIRTGVQVYAVVMSDVFRRQRLTAAAVLKHFLPGFVRDDPGMKIDGPVTKARLGGLEAATCTLRGSRSKQPGEHVEEILVAEQEGVAFELVGFAPVADYAAFRPIFLKIAADSRFGREARTRREASIEARRIVEQYKGSVVSIYAANDQVAGTGSGFIISRDGYVLTNYHVAFDTQTGAPMKEFTVEWDESLRRPKVKAELVGGRYRMIPQLFQHGVDVALLKIPPGNYEPLPLSPLAEVEAGDGVVTLGFPSRGMMEGVSLTVTTGVVTRFNRGLQGEIVSALIDAAITHGSSGGPCVSLVTGGVIGLNSFGMDVQLDPRSARLNDLIKYYGVVPIDAAIREFPLVCLPGFNPEGSGYDFFDCLELSKYFLSVGSFGAAEQMALRAVSLEPKQAIARMRLGECRHAAAGDALAGGDATRAQGLIDAARKAYTEALAREPRRSAALVAFARLEMQQNRLREAADLAARAAEADPEGWEGNFELANICLLQSRLDDALRYIDKAKAVVGGLIVEPHELAAMIHTARKDFAAARKEWTEAARISPLYLPARLGVASYFEQVGQADAAVAEYKRVLDDFPENAEVLGRIGLCLQNGGRAADAAGYFAQCVQRCQATKQAPDGAVLMYFGDHLMQGRDNMAAVPVFVLYLYYYRQGPWAANASLKIAGILAPQHALGLARIHARLATQASQAADVAQAAAQFPEAPLSLPEIQAMVGPLQYPPELAAELIAGATLGFTVDESQLAQLQQQGLPEPVLRAIVASLSQHPPSPTPPEPGAGPGPSAALPAPGPAFAPPGAAVSPPSAVPSGPAAPNLVGTWVANGMTAQQVPFRSVIIFGDLGLFTSNTWVGFQSLGLMRGTYRIENGRLILQPEGGPPFAPGCQIEGDTMVMDVVNFGPGVRFARERGPDGAPE